VERFRGHVSRSLALPKDADVEGIEAEMLHGVLTVTIPKVAETVERATTIEIK